MLVYGEKEKGSKHLQIRVRGQKEQEEIDKKKFIERVRREIDERKG